MRSWISGSCFRSMGCNPLPVRRLTSSSQRCLRRFCRHPPPANGHRQRRTAAIPGATANASRKVTRRWPRTSVVYRAARSVLESLRRVKLPACTQCEPPARVPTTPYYRTIAWAATALAGSSPPQPPAGRSPCPPVSQPSTTSPYRSGASSQLKCPAGSRWRRLRGSRSCRNSALTAGTNSSSRPPTISTGDSIPCVGLKIVSANLRRQGPAGNGVEHRAEDLLRVDLTVAVEVGGLDDVLQRARYPQRNRGTTAADRQTVHQLRVGCRREQRRCRADVGADKVHRSQLPLLDQPHKEPTHRPRRQQIQTSLGLSEPRQVDRHQVEVFGQAVPHLAECEQALRPGICQHDRVVHFLTSLRVANPQAIGCAERCLYRRHALNPPWSPSALALAEAPPGTVRPERQPPPRMRRVVSAISAFRYAWPSMPQPPSDASEISTHVRSANVGSPAAAVTISVISLTTPSFLSRSSTPAGVNTLMRT